MAVTIDQLTEGYWWFQRGQDAPLVIVEIERGSRGLPAIRTFSGYRHDDVLPMLPYLVAPVAPHREKNNLILIGWLANRTAYVNLPREEAIRRYLSENDDLDENYLIENALIEEYQFVDEFWAYDASGPTRVKP